MEAASPSRAGMAKSHKNCLQEFTQRSSMPLPVYNTISVGRLFKSSVVVDGTTFTSSHTFGKIKAAEQDVAKLAFESISWKIKHEGVPLIDEDLKFCKSILREYTVKMKLEEPEYTTSQSQGLLPMFISSLNFCGQIYTGSAGRSKKEAEQLSARTAIESVLANSDNSTVMFEIIKSKGLYSPVSKGGASTISCDKDITLRSPTENNCNSCIVKEKEVELALTNYEVSGSTYSGDRQLIEATATQSVSGGVKIPEQEDTFEPSSETAGGGSLQRLLPEGGLPASESYYAQGSQSIDGNHLIGPSLEPGNSAGVVLNSARKCRNKKRKGGQKGEEQSKKSRSDEQVNGRLRTLLNILFLLVP